MAKTNKLYLIFAFLFIVSAINLASAEVETLGTFKQDQCVDIIQTCSNCTYVKLSGIAYPNSTNAITPTITMTKDGTRFNYTFCDTDFVGEYVVNGFADVDGVDTVFGYNFFVTTTGENIGISEGFVLIGQFSAMILFLVIGLSFSKEKWKLKLSFIVLSLIMCTVLLNSTRIIASRSGYLSTMGEVGLWVGIVIVWIMIAIFLLFALIETFDYFKKKKERKWL